MKLPRDRSGRSLAKLLERFDYGIDHQTGTTYVQLERWAALRNLCYNIGQFC
jgi:hypothetical protein